MNYNLRKRSTKMPTPSNGGRESPVENETTELEQMKKTLQEREKEIAALQEKNEEFQLREMEIRRRESRQIQAREEEIENLQEQLRRGSSRPLPTTMSHATPKVKLDKYDGKTSIIQWWLKFITFINLQRLTEKMAIETLPFYLAGAAESWFFSLDEAFKHSLSTIKEAIHQRFQPSSRNNLQLMDVKQKQTESVEDFIHRVTQMTTDRRVDQDWLITVIMNGLKPDIGADVIKVDPKSLEELRNVAARAEVAERRRTNSPALQENTNLALLNALQEIRDDMKANQRKFSPQQSRRPGKPKPQQGYRLPPPQAYQQSPPWHQQPPTQWQQPPPPPGPQPGYNRPPQPYNNKGNFGIQHYMFGVFMMLSLCMVMGQASQVDPSTTNVIQRINYGVIFQQQSKIMLAQEYWLHTFHIPLPTRFKVKKVPFCSLGNTHEIASCLLLNNLANFIHGLHEETLLHFNETLQSIRNMIPQTKLISNQRQTRALLPFIGSLSKSIFGTATMDDVNILAGHINALNRKTETLAKALEQHGSHLSSFISLTDKRMKNLVHGIKSNSDYITSVATAFNNKLYNLEAAFTNVSEILINQVNQATLLRSKFTKLENAVENLLEGKISPFLIPKHILSKVISNIRHKLRKSYQKFYLVQLDASFYYSGGKFLFARHNNNLFITVKFPISSQRLPLNLYKVISLPVPTSENVTSKMQATQLLSLSDYFAITPHHDYFLSLNSKELTDCVHGTSILCYSNWAQSPITVPDCTMALFANDVRKIKELCNFRYLQNLLKSNILELSPTSVLLYNTPTVILDCPKEKKVLKGCAFCVVHIPCRCSLSTETLFFAPRLVNCYKSSSNFSVIHPVNLALLQEFFDESKLSHVFGNTYFPTPINMSIPEFVFYNHTMHDVLANDQKAHLNLKKIAKAVKNDQKIFKSLAEPLLDGQIEIPQEWPNTSDIITLVSLCLAGLCLIVCILLCIKVRKICTTLLILKEVQHASSKDIPSFIYRKPVT
ncbi:uncharacterized protein LOC134265486, partial [Saccostrea cucullata]|uniref:uncharacterized protein LOC134265486 n=1 Tax=Saccostrea cuccullata TaxID=36930 RepID=UPI002ED22557